MAAEKNRGTIKGRMNVAKIYSVHLFGISHLSGNRLLRSTRERNITGH